ncbi:hypothetical protein BU17DRAFT_65850 [Hysterangium stoloniferum]|nr:hypothetical protein BU17DRAFT_65850 [Hysterangium stoloniferum]
MLGFVNGLGLFATVPTCGPGGVVSQNVGAIVPFWVNFFQTDAKPSNWTTQYASSQLTPNDPLDTGYRLQKAASKQPLIGRHAEEVSATIRLDLCIAVVSTILWSLDAVGMGLSRSTVAMLICSAHDPSVKAIAVALASVHGGTLLAPLTIGGIFSTLDWLLVVGYITVGDRYSATARVILIFTGGLQCSTLKLGFSRLTVLDRQI